MRDPQPHRDGNVDRQRGPDANDSRDPPGTGADRHANLGAGEIPVERLEAMIREAEAPVIVETPRELDALRADLEFVRRALG